MRLARNAGRISAWIAVTCAIALCACASDTVAPGEQKVVSGFALAPYAMHEECAQLAIGDRLEFDFRSSAAVDFNIHYHEGKVVVMPVSREQANADSGIFIARIAQDYCLMWEAAATPASLDYKVRVRPVAR